MAEFMLNQRGQAFSVFKLLIAAIVAIVILTLLLQIIGLVQKPGAQNDPTTAASNLVAELKNKKASVRQSPQPAEFQPNSSINSKGISSQANVGLTPKQICLSLGDIPSDPEKGFELTTIEEVSSIAYKGSTTLPVTLVGLCDVGSELSDSAKLQGSAFTEGWLGDCGCADATGPNSQQTCCAVALKYQN